MEYHFIFLLKQLNLSLEKYKKKQMESIDISPSQCLMLDCLLLHEAEDICATKLHEILGISKPSISSALKKLRKKGYLIITADPTDARKRNIILTSKAYSVKHLIVSSLYEQEESLCQNLSVKDLEITEKSLCTMIRNMKQEPIRRYTL